MATPVENILAQANALSPEDREELIIALQAGEEPPVPRVSMLGKYKGCLSSVDEFLRRKHEDNEREDP